MTRTVVIRRDYLHYIKKYNRYEKRHKNVSAHVSPAFKLNVGDSVIVGQCRCVRASIRKRRGSAGAGRASLSIVVVFQIVMLNMHLTAFDSLESHLVNLLLNSHAPTTTSARRMAV